jgi:hypothetical protein
LPSLYALGNGLNFFSRFINLASISPSLEARKNYHFSISNELNGINQFFFICIACHVCSVSSLWVQREGKTCHLYEFIKMTNTIWSTWSRKNASFFCFQSPYTIRGTKDTKVKVISKDYIWHVAFMYHYPKP